MQACAHFFSTDYCNDYLNAAWSSWFDLDPWLRSRIIIQKFNQSSLVLRMYHRRVPFVHPEESLRQTKEPAHIFLSLESIFGKLQGSTSECCCSSILEHMFYRQHHTEVIPGSLQICIYIKQRQFYLSRPFFPRCVISFHLVVSLLVFEMQEVVVQLDFSVVVVAACYH